MGVFFYSLLLTKVSGREVVGVPIDLDANGRGAWLRFLGSNSAQQGAQQAPPYQQPYPYQAPPAAPQYQAPPAAPQGQGAGADSGSLAQLKLLGELHESGVLTDDEFERQKQRILGG